MRSTLFIPLAIYLSIVAPNNSYGQPPLEIVPGEAIFNVFVNSTPVGLERTVLSKTLSGWRISSSGQISAPVNLQTNVFAVTYDDEWKPEQLVLEGTRNGNSFSIQTTFNSGTATSMIRAGNQPTTRTDQINSNAAILPDIVFTGYESFAIHLSDLVAGDELPVFVASRGQITARVNAVRRQQIRTAQRSMTARIHSVTLMDVAQQIEADIWTDDNHRLLRVSIPSFRFEIARQDIVSVSSQLTGNRLDEDEDVRVNASGFSLAVTVTLPTDAGTTESGRWPAVVLVSGSEALDRNATLSGVPIFAHLAASLSKSGYLVVRYDKRGTGQSGGRPESARLSDYAEDLRDLVHFLDDRDDVDRDRIVVVGHNEGGWTSLLAAAQENKISAVALLETPSTRGADFVLEKQELELDRLSSNATDRHEKIELQSRINSAVLDDGPWDGIPDRLRTQADTPWFRSFLEFDPSETIRRIRQPMLVIQGELDQQVLPYHASRIDEMVRAYRRTTIEVVYLEGINHLLVPATTGSVDEYSVLIDQQVSPRVAETLINWLAGAAKKN